MVLLMSDINQNLKQSNNPYKQIITLNDGYNHLLVVNNNDEIGKVFIKDRILEKNIQRIIEKLTSENQTIIEVGANYAHFSLTMAHKVGNNGKVIIYEPTPILYEVILETISL